MWETRTVRDTFGWHTYSDAMLDGDRILRISTSEHFGGRVRTNAMCLSVWDGIRAHSILRDFHEKIAETTAPHTKEAIQSIHRQVMERYAGDIISRAVKFYRVAA